MLKMEEFLMIRDLFNQGLNKSQIARKTGYDRKTGRKYISAKYVPRAQTRGSKLSKLDPYKEGD